MTINKANEIEPHEVISRELLSQLLREFVSTARYFDRLISIDARRQVRISKENCSCDDVRASAMQQAWPRCASTEGSGRQLKRSANPTTPSPYDLAHLITFNIDESRICFSISTHP